MYLPGVSSDLFQILLSTHWLMCLCVWSSGVSGTGTRSGNRGNGAETGGLYLQLQQLHTSD